MILIRRNWIRLWRARDDAAAFVCVQAGWTGNSSVRGGANINWMVMLCAECTAFAYKEWDQLLREDAEEN